MSWIGNERDLIDRKLIRDPESGWMVHEPLLHPGRDIYFWWTRKYHTCKDGTVSVYKHFHFSMGGDKKTYYCPDGDDFPDEFFSEYHLLVLNYTWLLGNWRNFVRAPKIKKIKRKKGRPRIFPPEFYELLDMAGFGTIGSDIVIKYKRYLSLPCCEFRFGLLSEADRQAIGSAERLRDLCKSAYSLLKSRNRRSISTTYEQCFRDTAVEELKLD